MEKYVTVSGDQWDMISFGLFGTERYTGDLMRANMEYLDIVVFPAGITLNVPDIDMESSDLPPWREEIDKESDDEDEFYEESGEGY